MKKFTDFIVEKRHSILVLFIILSVAAVILSQKVNINYEIAEYLPSTSETRKGMDIMEDKFKKIKSSSLNLMFENLQEDKKTEIYDELTQIKGVDSYYYQNNFYLELNKPINKRKYLDILEKSEILYNDTYKVINEGLKIKV